MLGCLKIFINDPIHSFEDSFDLSRSHSLNDVLQAREDVALSIKRELELMTSCDISNFVEFNKSNAQACLFQRNASLMRLI